VENFKFLYPLKACLAIANVASLCTSVLGSLTGAFDEAVLVATFNGGGVGQQQGGGEM
jgi:hypothetical protein